MYNKALVCAFFSSCSEEQRCNAIVYDQIFDKSLIYDDQEEGGLWLCPIQEREREREREGERERENAVWFQ